MKSPLAFIFATAMGTAQATNVSINGDTIRVVDGDTVAVECGLYEGCSQKLRFALTDAPELGRTACEEERRTGLRAKARLGELLRGREITIVYLGKNDKYGRPLAVLISPEGIPEITLLAEGLTDFYSPRRRSVEQHRARWCPLQ